MFKCPKCGEIMSYDWISGVVRCQNMQCNFKTDWNTAMNKYIKEPKKIVERRASI